MPGKRPLMDLPVKQVFSGDFMEEHVSYASGLKRREKELKENQNPAFCNRKLLVLHLDDEVSSRRPNPPEVYLDKFGVLYPEELYKNFSNSKSSKSNLLRKALKNKDGNHGAGPSTRGESSKEVSSELGQTRIGDSMIRGPEAFEQQTSENCDPLQKVKRRGLILDMQHPNDCARERTGEDTEQALAYDGDYKSLSEQSIPTRYSEDSQYSDAVLECYDLDRR